MAASSPPHISGGVAPKATEGLSDAPQTPAGNYVFKLPDVGEVLEVGCGHGLLSLYLGLQSPRRHEVGVDIDAAKIAEAQDALAQLQPSEADGTFEVASPG